MHNLAASQSSSHADEVGHPSAAEAAATAVAPGSDVPAAARMIARARWLMVVSGLTTLIALAAVLGVIGYRVFHAGGSGAPAPAEAVITLPKGTRVIASAVTAEHIVVTLDIGGATEIRTFDVRSLKETGRIRFATAP